MAYQSEKELEDHSIELLGSLGWEFIKIPDEQALINNFRVQVNSFNQYSLNGKELSDSEFSRLYNTITGKGVFDSAHILRETQVLQRDDNSTVTISLFNKKDWCQNIFQVTHQTTIKGKAKNRYDINLLVNGLPIGQLELKKRGGSFREAFNQIERYRRDSFHGLYNFLEMFIVSDGVNTKYFANNDGEVLYSQTFHWSDENNTVINILEDFISSFLSPCHFAKLIARFTVLRESEKRLLVMRPYQIYAVEKVVSRAIDSGENGYVWHTTGSGKTLTAFKIGEILSNAQKFKNTIVLVDRQDLDQQTIDEFNAFSPESIDATENTKSLVRDLKDKNKKLIVTTIQKMNHALKSHTKEITILFDENVVFIIDECHRSQLGEMHKLIKKSFTKAQYFGFTGTPIFQNNKPAGQEFTTGDLFGECLHKYLLPNGIKDGNVLGFEIKYFDTVQQVRPIDHDELVQSILTDELLHSPVRMKNIAIEIMKQHDRNTMERQYSALFATDSVDSLVKYYDFIKEAQKGSDKPLKVAGIYFYTTNEDMSGKTESARDAQVRIINDYNAMFGTSFSVETFNLYFKDVSRRLKNGEIDILIVVDMLLTGFDSKYLNTLYIDKNMKHHGLVQALSRTNRVELPRKKYGLIRSFRPLKENVDEAIRIFSDSNNSSFALAAPYYEYLSKLNKAIEELKSITPDVASVDALMGETAQEDFVNRFRTVASLINTMKPYVEFEFDDEQFGMTEQEFMDFRSKYLDLNERVRNETQGTSVLQYVDFAIEEVFSDTINVDYIMRLISGINLTNPADVERSVKHIIEQITNSDSPELILKSEHLRKFLETVVLNLSGSDNVDVALNKFNNDETEREIKAFSARLFPNEADIRSEMILRWLSDYEFSGTINETEISTSLKVDLKEKKRLKDEIIKFIKGISGKY